MAKYLLIILIVVCAGCSRKTAPPVVVTQTSLQSDSLVRSLFTLFVTDHKETRSDSFVFNKSYVEKATVNEKGDTLRLDTHTETSTAQYQALERDNRVLRSRIDSLEKVKNRVDTVPMPYEVRVPVEVERKLNTWEKFRLRAFWPLVVCVAAIIGWRFLRRRYLIK